MTSASLSSSGFLLFQLLARRGSFLGAIGTIAAGAVTERGMKLDFAALEATTGAGGGGTSAAILAAREFLRMPEAGSSAGVGALAGVGAAGAGAAVFLGGLLAALAGAGALGALAGAAFLTGAGLAGVAFWTGAFFAGAFLAAAGLAGAAAFLGTGFAAGFLAVGLAAAEAVGGFLAAGAFFATVLAGAAFLAGLGLALAGAALAAGFFRGVLDLATADLGAGLAAVFFFAAGRALVLTEVSSEARDRTQCATAWGSLGTACTLGGATSYKCDSARDCSHKPLQESLARKQVLWNYTKACSKPWRKMSWGRSMPMNTILLTRFSPSPQAGPRSLPMSWCTPWKITLRSVPFMCSTPL